MGQPKNHGQIEPLGYPNLFRFRAAEGWLELGDFQAATHELNRVTSGAQGHFEVLHLRWRILAKSNDWKACLPIARALAARYPHHAGSWVALAETWYQLGDPEQAYALAYAQAPAFPQCYELIYDTACYACLIGKFAEAKRFFRLAMLIANERLRVSSEQSGSSPRRPARLGPARLRPAARD
jgi:tetratricopeptide (TPR) repeat protein